MCAVRRGNGRPSSVGERDRDEEHVLVADDARRVPCAGRVFQEQHAADGKAPDRAVAGRDFVFAAEGAEQLAPRRRVRDLAIPLRRGADETAPPRREERGDVEGRRRRREVGRLQRDVDLREVRLALLVREQPHVAHQSHPRSSPFRRAEPRRLATLGSGARLRSLDPLRSWHERRIGVGWDGAASCQRRVQTCVKHVVARRDSPTAFPCPDA